MSLTSIETAVLQEIERRQLINTVVDCLLVNNFEFTGNKFNRIKRGEVHEFVAKEMGVTLNNTLCNTIRERVELLGGMFRTINGTLYYLSIIRKTPKM